MGWIGNWNDEHQARQIAAIAVSDPATEDIHEVVDRYLEAGTGHCAARVHDTDLQNALLLYTVVKTTLVDGDAIGNIAVGGAPTVVATIDMSSHRAVYWVIKNTGANQVDAYSVYPFTDPDLNYGTQYNMGAIAAGSAQGSHSGNGAAGGWRNTEFSEYAGRTIRIIAVSAAGTTVRVEAIGLR